MGSVLTKILGPEPKYNVWFRHTGMELPDRWMEKRTHEYTLKGLSRETEGRKVTHMVMKCSVLPDIHLIAPELSHLRLKEVTENSNLSYMSKLNKLEVLSMSSNNFGSEGIPDIFTDMVALRELDIRHCRLAILPVSMSKLNKLEVLRMYENNFGSEGIPDIFTDMVALRELNISECGLTTLPVSMSKLNKLEVLSMSGNNFGSEGIPDIFTDMVTLRELDISVCGLTTLPVSMKNLQHLQTLDISYNLFATLPTVVCELKNLRTLGIGGNYSQVSLDAKILQLTQLQHLDIDECEALTSPPAEVCQRGPLAIRQYYTDLAEGSSVNEVETEKLKSVVDKRKEERASLQPSTNTDHGETTTDVVPKVTV